MSSAPVGRKPYTVNYIDQNGERKSYKRLPPEKQHDLLPTDKVELNHRHSSDFVNGGIYTVKSVQSRNPNVLQLQDKSGNSTFVNASDVRADQLIAERDGIDPRDLPSRSRYLLWP